MQGKGTPIVRNENKIIAVLVDTCMCRKGVARYSPLLGPVIIKTLFYPPFKTRDLLTLFKRMYPLKCALQLKLKVINGYLLCILEQNNSNCNYPGINSKSDFPTSQERMLGIYHISLPVMLHAHAKILQCSCLREDFKNV